MAVTGETNVLQRIADGCRTCRPRCARSAEYVLERPDDHRSR